MPASKWIAALALLALAGCAQMVKVEPGTSSMKDLEVTTKEGWNRFQGTNVNLSVAPGAAELWTQDGVTLDVVAFFPAVAEGETLGRAMGQRKLTPFRASMSPHEIVELYEQLVTQEGSSFKLVRLAPATVGGTPGFRFEHTILRRSDGVQLRGHAHGAVIGGKLYLIAYTAPSLYFYERHRERAEAVAATARVTPPKPAP